MLAAHEQLRRSVVLCDHFLRHVSRDILLADTGETEITNFEQTITVDQKVPGLDVAMDDAGRVEVLETSEYLIEEHLDVICCERLRGDDDFV